MFYGRTHEQSPVLMSQSLPLPKLTLLCLLREVSPWEHSLARSTVAPRCSPGVPAWGTQPIFTGSWLSRILGLFCIGPAHKSYGGRLATGPWSQGPSEELSWNLSCNPYNSKIHWLHCDIASNPGHSWVTCLFVPFTNIYWAPAMCINDACLHSRHRGNLIHQHTLATHNMAQWPHRGACTSWLGRDSSSICNSFLIYDF